MHNVLSVQHLLCKVCAGCAQCTRSLLQHLWALEQCSEGQLQGQLRQCRLRKPTTSICVNLQCFVPPLKPAIYSNQPEARFPELSFAQLMASESAACNNHMSMRHRVRSTAGCAHARSIQRVTWTCPIRAATKSLRRNPESSHARHNAPHLRVAI